jgi:hypothetical protein
MWRQTGEGGTEAGELEVVMTPSLQNCAHREDDCEKVTLWVKMVPLTC